MKPLAAVLMFVAAVAGVVASISYLFLCVRAPRAGETVMAGPARSAEAFLALGLNGLLVFIAIFVIAWS